MRRPPTPPAWFRARRSTLRRAATAAMWTLVGVVTPGDACAQVAEAPPAERKDDLALVEPPPGASLPVDRDMDNLLAKAAEYVRQQQFTEASLVLQHLIDASGSVLGLDLPVDAPVEAGRDFVYRPMREQVEQVLASLPPRGLDIYRFAADGEAKAILAAAVEGDEESALRQIVRRYFISSVGDDAAFRLASILMDRADFAGAAVLLRRIQGVHPDPSIPQDQLQSRLAIVAARLGDHATAKEAARRLETAGASPAMLAVVRRECDRSPVPASTVPDASHASWPLAHGTPGRNAQPLPMPQALAEGLKPLAQQWSFQHDWPVPANAVTGFMIVNDPRNRGSAQATPRARVVQQWLASGSLPTSQLLLHQGLVYFRGTKATYCLSAQTGLVRGYPRWMVNDSPDLYQTGGNASFNGVVMVNGTRYDAMSRTPEQIVYFGDRAAKSMSIIDNVAYFIEGPTTAMRQSGPIHMQRGNVGPTNRLNAVDAITGKRVGWSLLPDARPPAAAAPPEPKSEQRFVAPPTPAADLLLVPVEDGESLHLLGVERADARPDRFRPAAVRYREFLCSGPAGNSARWAPVGISVDGDDAFISTGRGVVLCVDVRDGSIRWAARYPRIAPPSPDRRNPFGEARSPDPLGWDDDTIIVHGGTLLVFASDNQNVLALDRVTGRTRYIIEPGDDARRYPLGLWGDDLLIAGVNVIRQCRLSAEGKLVAEARVEGMSGRATLAGDWVLAPQRDRLVRRSLRNDLGDAGSIRVNVPEGDPLGNLMTDGQRLLAVGMNQVYCYVDTRQLMADMDRAVAAGDAAAMVERARLRREMEQWEPAAADLRAAMAALPEGAGRESARQALLAVLLDLAKSQPERSAAAFTEAATLVADPADRWALTLTQSRMLMAAGRFDEAASLLQTVAAADTQAIPLRGEGAVTRAVPAWIAGRMLRELAAKEPAAARALRQRAPESLRAVSRQPTVETLLGMARAHPLTSEAAAATEQAAWLAADNGQIEQAELLLRDLADAGDDFASPPALAALARLHARRGWARQAAGEWRELAARYHWASMEMEGGARPVKSIVEQALAELGPAAKPAQSGPDVLAEPPLKPYWRVESPGAALLDDGSPLTQFLSETALFYLPASHQILARRLTDGEPRWAMDRLPQTTPEAVVREGRVFAARGLLFPNGGVRRDGHVGILWTNDRVVGVGLVSGKQLWEYRIEGRLSDRSPGVQWGNGVFNATGLEKVDASAGVVAVHVAESRFDAVHVLDSGTGRLRWSRQFDRQPIDGVRVVGGMVAVASEGGSRLALFDRHDGHLVRDISLAGRNDRMPLAWTDEVVAYASTDGRLGVRSLADGQSRIVPMASVQFSRMANLGRGILVLIEPVGDGNGPSHNLHLVNLTEIPVRHWSVKGAAAGMQSIHDVGLSRDGGTLAAVARKGAEMSVLLFNVRTGQIMAKAQAPEGRAMRIDIRSIAGSGELLPALVSDMAVETPGQRVKQPVKFALGFLRRSEPGLTPAASVLRDWAERPSASPQAPPMVFGGLLFLNEDRNVVGLGPGGPP